MQRSFFLFFISSFFALNISTVQAQTLSSNPAMRAAQVRTQCTPTPSTKGAMNYYPKVDAIYPGNNLAKPAGKPEAVAGQVVIVRGQLLDSRCMPVTNALVELWQADGNGRYGVSSMGARSNPYPLFTGNGRATTNNLGQFEFVTLFPDPVQEKATAAKPKKSKKKKGKKKSSATEEAPTVATSGLRTPLLHFLVRHQDFKPFASEFFFEGDRRNDADATYAALSAEAKEQLTLHLINISEEQIELRARIVLPGALPFQRY